MQSILRIFLWQVSWFWLRGNCFLAVEPPAAGGRSNGAGTFQTPCAYGRYDCDDHSTVWCARSNPPWLIWQTSGTVSKVNAVLGQMMPPGRFWQPGTGIAPAGRLSWPWLNWWSAQKNLDTLLI